jgi:hypothetical protein
VNGYRQEFLKIDLPFQQKARDGDFLFYTPIDSILPNPFTSVNDLIPKSRLEVLTEFAFYPSCWSSYHQAAAYLDDGKIS